MSVKKTYETDRKRDYAAASNGQVVSRSLFAVIERGDMPLDGGFGEAELRVRIDTVPQDTVATSPDTAARAATAMQSLSDDYGNRLGFRVDYQAN